MLSITRCVCQHLSLFSIGNDVTATSKLKHLVYMCLLVLVSKQRCSNSLVQMTHVFVVTEVSPRELLINWMSLIPDRLEFVPFARTHTQRSQCNWNGWCVNLCTPSHPSAPSKHTEKRDNQSEYSSYIWRIQRRPWPEESDGLCLAFSLGFATIRKTYKNSPIAYGCLELCQDL